jgi:hypothetical protein
MVAQFRRMYIYFMCAVSLTVVAAGVVNVLNIAAIHVWGILSGARQFQESATAVRQDLSLFLAFIGVGLPILLLHAYLAERWASEEKHDDRRSDLRGLYFTAVLAISLIIFTTALLPMVNSAVTRLIGRWVFFSGRDAIFSLLIITVVAVVWSLHVWMRHRDTRLMQLPETANEPLRLYLYGAAFIGIMLLLSGLAELLSILFRNLVVLGTEFFSFDWLGASFASATSRIVVGGLIWGLHWSYSLATIRDHGWRGARERQSRVRRAYLFLALVIAVSVTVIATSFALSEVLNVLFGEETVRTGMSMAARDLAFAAPFALLWRYHRNRILFEAREFYGGDALSSAARLYGYIVSFVALVLGSVGLGYLAGVTLELAFDAVGLVDAVTIWGDETTSVFGAMLIVGVALWLPFWIPAESALEADPEIESRATSRRAYLYLVLSFSTLALLVSLATLLYQIFQSVLGVRGTPGLGGDIALLLGVSLVAVGFLAYHLRLLLRDAGISGPATTVVREAEPAQIHLLLSGTDERTLREVLTRLQSQLPERVELSESGLEPRVETDEPDSGTRQTGALTGSLHSPRQHGTTG